MPHRGTETEFELTTIERFEQLDYDYTHGSELDRPPTEVVLRDALRSNLSKRYPSLPAPSLDEAVSRFSRPEGVDTVRRNMAFHRDLREGIELRLEHEDGRVEHKHIYAIDWNKPELNHFLVVNQLSIRGKNDRRPDMVVYVNGLPLVVFELKNPYDEKPSVDDALNQLDHYKVDIPQLFEFNAITVVSDGVTTLHGMWTSRAEWFAPWKSIDGLDIEANTTGSMKSLIEGLFPKARLLSYVRDFILFEVVNDKILKKGAKYHQFFAVTIASEKATTACQPNGQKRIGVIWHTTGSGKSLSMLFLVAILRRTLDNPAFVIEVDRNDLDDQLHDQFVAGRGLVGDVKHATSVDTLRSLLATQGGEVVFTTLEKFKLKKGADGREELEHPILSERSDIIVIADEAHRSQYGFQKGYARYLTEALPNARRIGFTGTPISVEGADTVAVFGDLIHTYDIKQSQEDNATVRIHYYPRQARLHLSRTDVDKSLAEITAGHTVSELERKKSQWAALAEAAGAKERVDKIARDLLDHFNERSSTLDGKALAVCMTRRNCVRLYDALTALPGCPEVKVVMTGNLSEDPKEWNEAGHITTKLGRDSIKQRMIDPDDPLKIAIVCDMWLTGTDIPCLHTLYIDKPMKGHNVIQAISRVNRVFRDKPHGLIVDYIGIGDDLRSATNQYTSGGGKGIPAPDISDEGKDICFECIEVVRKLLPEGPQYGQWRRLTRIQLEDQYSKVYGHLTERDALRDEFLQAELKLTQAYTLVKHLDDCRHLADEVTFYQRVRNQLRKTLPGHKPARSLDQAVRDLVDDSVESEDIVDIFAVAGIKQADISILDDKFLQTFKDKPHENLRLKLLHKLIADEIRRRQHQNLAKAKSFRELLEKTLQDYHKRLIDAAAVIKAMLEIRKEMEDSDKRAKALGLEEEELAFYDAVATNYNKVYSVDFLRDLIHDVVQTVKRNLKVDWTEPHREDVKAEVRAAVKRVLRKRNVKSEDFDPLVAAIMEQAEALYGEWPTAA